MTRMLLVLILVFVSLTSNTSASEAIFPVFTTEQSKYVGTIKVESNFRIRLLVLRHSFDGNAIRDCKNIVEVADLSAKNGLDISTIGNFNVNRGGLATKDQSWKKIEGFDNLRKFVSEQMKINAVVGDCLIIQSLGHGGTGQNGNGFIEQIGNRKEFIKSLARAAAENNQITLHLSFSCHSGAGVDKAFSEMTEDEKNVFCSLASSPSSQLSWFGIPPKEVAKILGAVSEDNEDIDPNHDQQITSKEFKNFLNNWKSGRGDLLSFGSPDMVIFGFSIVNRIPIVDLSGNTILSSKNFIPLPKN